MARKNGDTGKKSRRIRQAAPKKGGSTSQDHPSAKENRGTMFEVERRTYEEHLPELLSSVGKFVLILGEEIGGRFDTFEAAIAAGYEKYGVRPFLVKQINAVEPVMHFSRELP